MGDISVRNPADPSNNRSNASIEHDKPTVAEHHSDSSDKHGNRTNIQHIDTNVERSFYYKSITTNNVEVINSAQEIQQINSAIR